MYIFSTLIYDPHSLKKKSIIDFDFFPSNYLLTYKKVDSYIIKAIYQIWMKFLLFCFLFFVPMLFYIYILLILLYIRLYNWLGNYIGKYIRLFTGIKWSAILFYDFRIFCFQNALSSAKKIFFCEYREITFKLPIVSTVM